MTVAADFERELASRADDDGFSVDAQRDMRLEELDLQPVRMLSSPVAIEAFDTERVAACLRDRVLQAPVVRSIDVGGGDDSPVSVDQSE